MRSNDPNVYVVCDYGATGEGRTVMTLVTRAYPRIDLGDYAVEPHFDKNGVNYGVEKTTPEERALREFKEIFGGYFSIGAEVVDRYEFFDRYSNYIPQILYQVTDTENENYPPGFSWHGQLHLNYS